MARNSSGTYTLPIAAFVSGTTIKSADMNSNLSDIATALTQSLATTGVSSMTGPLKLADGSLAAPSLTLASDVTTGWYKSGAGTWTYVGSGTSIATFSPTGISIGNLTVVNLTVTGAFTVASARIVGEVVDFTGAAGSVPALFLLPYGQAISRVTYAALNSLYSAAGYPYGVGDGATTFNVPDYRGMVTAGKDDMGGVARGLLTAAGSGITGTSLGGAGGLQNHILTVAQMPVHSHGINDPTHTHNTDTRADGQIGGATSIRTYGGANPVATTAASTGITLQNTGSGTAHNNCQPTLIVNKILYVAV